VQTASQYTQELTGDPPEKQNRRGASRPMGENSQLALDDDRLHEVEAVVRLAPGELDGARHARRARRFEAIAAVVFINERIRHEGAGANVVMTRRSEKIFYGDGPLCDFRGHLAVRRLSTELWSRLCSRFLDAKLCPRRHHVPLFPLREGQLDLR